MTITNEGQGKMAYVQVHGNPYGIEPGIYYIDRIVDGKFYELVGCGMLNVETVTKAFMDEYVEEY